MKIPTPKGWYIWKNGAPKEVTSWEELFAGGDPVGGIGAPHAHSVGYTTWPEMGCSVSTVFLSCSFPGTKPHLFETMVFWPHHSIDQAGERYQTIEEAREGHKRWVTRVIELMNNQCP